jgi:hypothetical protein
MVSTPTTAPKLTAEKIADACAALADRIHERFPGRGIDLHAHHLAEHARRLVATGSARITAPLPLRIVSWIGGIAASLLLLSPLWFVRRIDGIDVLPEFLQSLDSFITVLAATVAGFFTMRSVEHGVCRRQALGELHALRSFAHVTDMLQISKSPTRLLFPLARTRLTPEGEDDAVSMSRYLAYCAELYALIAKLAVLHGEWTSDATVLSAIDDLENLCSSLESKATQKILLLEQLNQRVQPVGG